MCRFPFVPLRPLPPREALRRLHRAGFVEVRQRGSHLRLRHMNGRAVTVAVHSRDLTRLRIRDILRQAGLTEEEWDRL